MSLLPHKKMSLLPFHLICYPAPVYSPFLAANCGMYEYILSEESLLSYFYPPFKILYVLHLLQLSSLSLLALTTKTSITKRHFYLMGMTHLVETPPLYLDYLTVEEHLENFHEL